MPKSKKRIKELKTGTFLCKFFGHKFVHEGKDYIGRDGLYDKFSHSMQRTNFCVRCGIYNNLNAK